MADVKIEKDLASLTEGLKGVKLAALDGESSEPLELQAIN